MDFPLPLRPYMRCLPTSRWLTHGQRQKLCFTTPVSVYLVIVFPVLMAWLSEQDILASAKTKDDFHREAAHLLNKGDRLSYTEGGSMISSTLAFLTRGMDSPCAAQDCGLSLAGIQQLATRSMDDAMRSFEGVLVEKPTNVVALLGKVRLPPFYVYNN